MRCEYINYKIRLIIILKVLNLESSSYKFFVVRSPFLSCDSHKFSSERRQICSSVRFSDAVLRSDSVNRTVNESVGDRRRWTKSGTIAGLMTQTPNSDILPLAWISFLVSQPPVTGHISSLRTLSAIPTRPLFPLNNGGSSVRQI